MNRFTNLMHLALMGLMVPPRDAYEELPDVQPITNTLGPGEGPIKESNLEIYMVPLDSRLERLDVLEELTSGFIPEDPAYFILLSQMFENGSSDTNMYVPQAIAAFEGVPEEVIRNSLERDYLAGQLALDGESVYTIKDLLTYAASEPDLMYDPSEQEINRMFRDDELSNVLDNQDIPYQARQRTMGDFGEGEWVDRDTLFDNSTATGPTLGITPGNLGYSGFRNMGPGVEGGWIAAGLIFGESQDEADLGYEIQPITPEQEADLLELFGDLFERYQPLNRK
ncbi:hypothetical protein HOD38_05945 [archaeon]|jgi:hypothetical protein|nr:hypothetical protein [archaeon]MBT4397780.1 hypothetical protein [archaeon]MBT4441114.1 hypothetical protein [archaeon]